MECPQCEIWVAITTRDETGEWYGVCHRCHKRVYDEPDPIPEDEDESEEEYDDEDEPDEEQQIDPGHSDPLSVDDASKKILDFLRSVINFREIQLIEGNCDTLWLDMTDGTTMAISPMQCEAEEG